MRINRYFASHRLRRSTLCLSWVKRLTSTLNSCFSTLQQNELRRITTFNNHVSNLSCNKWGFWMLCEFWLLTGKNSSQESRYIRVFHLLNAKQGGLGPIKRARCTDFVAKRKKYPILSSSKKTANHRFRVFWVQSFWSILSIFLFHRTAKIRYCPARCGSDR